jgi:hypothetical protein
VCYGQTDLFGDVDGGQQGAFLVAGWASAALFAGISHKHLVLAVRASNPGKTFLQIPTLEKGGHGALNDRPPETVLGLKTLIVDLLEGLKILVDQAPQVGGPRIAWSVQGGRFGTRHSHEKNAISRAAVGTRRAHSQPIDGAANVCVNS